MLAGNGPHTAHVAGKYADGFLTLVGPETYHEKLVPALESGAEEAGRDPGEIRRVRQLGVSYADDYETALDGVEFWTGSMAVSFDENVSDPREIERRAADIPRDEWAEWGLVTTDDDDIEAAVERHREAGFDEIEFLSTSPDQSRFLDALGGVVPA